MSFKKGISKHYSKHHTKHQPHLFSNQSMFSIFNNLSKKNTNITNNNFKLNNNLASRIMNINTSSHKPEHKITSNSTSKSVSSTFSSFTKNGKTHSKGKKVINNSTKPFIKIEEIKNGTKHHFIIPKNTISYKTIKYTKGKKGKKVTKSTKGKKGKKVTKSTKGKKESK